MSKNTQEVEEEIPGVQRLNYQKQHQCGSAVSGGSLPESTET